MASDADAEKEIENEGPVVQFTNVCIAVVDERGQCDGRALFLNDTWLKCNQYIFQE